MIIVAIIALSGIVFVYLMRTFAGLPLIPLEWMSYINELVPYVVRGVKFINGFMYAGVVIPLALVCLALHSWYVIYKIILWILKKIPMLGISD